MTMTTVVGVEVMATAMVMMTAQHGVAREFTDLVLRLILPWYSGKKIARRELVCSIMECVSLSLSLSLSLSAISLQTLLFPNLNNSLASID